jgi:hypothetical protein
MSGQLATRYLTLPEGRDCFTDRRAMPIEYLTDAITHGSLAVAVRSCGHERGRPVPVGPLPANGENPVYGVFVSTTAEKPEEYNSFLWSTVANK